jgi:4-amino-4-deoxy-L-arabinose transferase-like glycosyltransferase
MTVATINVLLGMISILFALAAALGALAYAVEGIRRRGRWSLVLAIVLGRFAWSMLTGVGQDFARASDVRLLSTPANAGGLIAVLVWTLISVSILVADATYFRRLHRTFAAQP